MDFDDMDPEEAVEEADEFILGDGEKRFVKKDRAVSVSFTVEELSGDQEEGEGMNSNYPKAVLAGMIERGRLTPRSSSSTSDEKVEEEEGFEEGSDDHNDSERSESQSPDRGISAMSDLNVEESKALVKDLLNDSSVDVDETRVSILSNAIDYEEDHKDRSTVLRFLEKKRNEFSTVDTNSEEESENS